MCLELAKLRHHCLPPSTSRVYVWGCKTFTLFINSLSKFSNRYCCPPHIFKGQIKLLPRYCRYLRISLINRSKQFQLIHNYPLRPCSSFSFFVMTFLILSIVKSYYALPKGFHFHGNQQIKRKFRWICILGWSLRQDWI